MGKITVDLDKLVELMQSFYAQGIDDAAHTPVALYEDITKDIVFQLDLLVKREADTRITPHGIGAYDNGTMYGHTVSTVAKAFMDTKDPDLKKACEMFLLHIQATAERELLEWESKRSHS